MKILVLSSTPWSKDNSFGNSFSNIFEGIDDIEIASISCKPGMPTSNLVKRCYQISEKALLKNLFNKNVKTGIEIEINDSIPSDDLSHEIKGREFGSKVRWQILFWIRDLIWKLGRWNTDELKAFIDDFSPDIIFQPIYFSSYLNDMVSFIKKHTGVPMLGYISDDCYTLKRVNFSPLYWIDRLYKRQKVKSSVKQCEILYVISQIQKDDYEKAFSIPCKILTKCADFSQQPVLKSKCSSPLQIVFTGNIGINRWKSLKIIADALENINRDNVKAQLRIYTATPLTKSMKKGLNRGNSSFIMGTVPASEVEDIQANADMVVHVEAFDFKNKLVVRQSFSTKLVDYFKIARPILAVGPNDVASIDHLIKNECAFIASNVKNVEKTILTVIDNPEILNDVAKKAYECGRQCHDKEQMQTMLYEDLKKYSKLQ